MKKGMGKIKVLNLYAGIGGNRKLWKNVEVTAVEIKPEIAKVYQDLYPNDEVIIEDAHQYLLNHYKEYDFIWSSPPCPTHSRFNNIKQNIDLFKKRYPDMSLYQEIIYLRHFFKGIWVIENVISYYDPLIKPYICGNHYIWSNKYISPFRDSKRNIRDKNYKYRLKRYGFEENLFDKYILREDLKVNIVNNCVNPELGLHIFNCCFSSKQLKLEL